MEKQRWEESKKRREEEKRSESRKTEKKEDAGTRKGRKVVDFTKASCQAWLKLLIANEVRIGGPGGGGSQSDHFEAVPQLILVALAVVFEAYVPTRWQLGDGGLRFPPGPSIALLGSIHRHALGATVKT